MFDFLNIIMIVYLNGLEKCLVLRLACINACRWYSMMGIVFFRILFEISSGLDALSGVRRLIVSCICLIVIYASYEIFCGWLVEKMSVRSAKNDLEKNAFLNILTFYSFITTWLFKVNINIDMKILIIYFLIWKMNLSLILFIYSF